MTMTPSWWHQTPPHTYELIALEDYGLKCVLLDANQGTGKPMFLSGAYIRKSVSLPLLASRGFLHSCSEASFPQLQRQSFWIQPSIQRAILSSLLLKTELIRLGLGGNPGYG